MTAFPPLPKRPRRWWRRKRTYVGMAAAAFIVWWLSPLFASNAEQDRCQFGTGSTALYVRLSAEAKAYLRQNGKVWLHGVWTMNTALFAKEMAAQLSQFAMVRATPTERIAALHALLREYGMRLDSSFPRASRPVETTASPIGADYSVLLPKLDPFCLRCYILMEAAFSIEIVNNGSGVWNKIRHTGLYIWHFNPKWAPPFQVRYDMDCPDVGSWSIKGEGVVQ